MGGAVKTLAVVAITVATAGVATPFFSILAGSTLIGGVLGAVTALAVSTVAGKALGLGKVNLDEAEPISSYAVSSLQNTTNNNNVVPTIYGEVRVGGTREFADLEDGSNTELYEIITFANHEVNDYIEIYANNELMTVGIGADADKWRFANDKILVQVYNVNPDTDIKAITAYSGAVWTTANLTSLTFQNTTFLDTDVPSGISFLVVHHIYNATDNNQRKQITARIQGKLIRPITSETVVGSTPIYSDNPAEIQLDFMTDENNFNEDDTKIDIKTFYDSKLLNIEYGFTCNIAFASKTNLSAAIQEINATNRSNIIFSQGIWKIKQDEKNKVVSFAITADDIISNTFSWSQGSSRDIANKVNVSWINPSEQWQTELSSIENTDLQASDGRIYIKEIQLRGVTVQLQAEKIAELTLNQFRYTEDSNEDRINVTPLTLTFTTTIKNPELEVGDMGTIDYFELPEVKKFVIMSIKTKQSGELVIVGREYANTQYKDISGNFII